MLYHKEHRFAPLIPSSVPGKNTIADDYEAKPPAQPLALAL